MARKLSRADGWLKLTPAHRPGDNSLVSTPAKAMGPPRDLRASRIPAVRRTLYVILLLNGLALAAKLAVALRTHSLSVLGAALESTLDLLNNVVGILLVGWSARGPDEDHPYGHEKFETLGALAIAGFLSITCFELLREGVQHLLGGHTPEVPTLPEMGLLVATLLVNAFVMLYERRRGRELQSQFLLADAAHTRSDIYVTLAAIASLVLANQGLGVADGALAILVALAIAWSGYSIVRDTIPVLVDERGIDAATVRAVVERLPQVADVRAVRSRTSASGYLFAEITIGVDAATSVADAHAIADEVEELVAAQWGSGAAEVTVHVEPA